MTTNADAVSGGCQCGAVRYRAVPRGDTAHICHCRMCQKAVGNAFAALINVMREDMRWTRGKPAQFSSSDGIDRGFCRACGTPLTYDFNASKHLNITIASLDDPAAFPPQAQFGLEARLPWFTTLGALPQEGTTEETMAAQVAGIRGSNRQHPDHDTQHWPA
jgi:hypothetical protein